MLNFLVYSLGQQTNIEDRVKVRYPETRAILVSLNIVNDLGIGDHLQHVSPPGKYDLHEPIRLLSDLGPYEHFERILRLCFAYYGRNI